LGAVQKPDLQENQLETNHSAFDCPIYPRSNNNFRPNKETDHNKVVEPFGPPTEAL